MMLVQVLIICLSCTIGASALVQDEDSDNMPSRFDEDVSRQDHRPSRYESGPSHDDSGPSRYEGGPSHGDSGPIRYDQEYSAGSANDACLVAVRSCVQPLVAAFGWENVNMEQLTNMASMKSVLDTTSRQQMCRKIKDINFDEMGDCVFGKLEACSGEQGTGSDIDRFSFESAKRLISSMQYICTDDCQDLGVEVKRITECVKKQDFQKTPDQMSDSEKAQACSVLQQDVVCVWQSTGRCQYTRVAVDLLVKVLEKTYTPLLKPVECDLPTSTASKGLEASSVLFWMLFFVWMVGHRCFSAA